MAKPKPNVEQKSLSELMAALDPDNPRIHTTKTDIPTLALRLLHYDWQKIATYNKRNKLLVGGHGRVMACEHLVQQSKEWFDDQWDRFVESNTGKLTEGEVISTKLRFAPKYWLQVPILVVDLNDKDHKIALLALNKAKGEDNPLKIAKLLSKMNELDAEAAGWGNDSDRTSFLSKFGLLKAKIEPVEEVTINAAAIATETLQHFEFIEAATDTEPVYEDVDVTAIAEGYLDEEPEVETGGANHNPIPPKTNQVVYPLNVSLGVNQAKKYEALKEKLNLKYDLTIMMKYHPAFVELPILEPTG